MMYQVNQGDTQQHDEPPRGQVSQVVTHYTGEPRCRPTTPQQQHRSGQSPTNSTGAVDCEDVGPEVLLEFPHLPGMANIL